MPESAISGLVEGLLQGHAIRQQKQRDAEEKNRQHAQDVAAYHIQDWKEKQAAELNKQNAAQQGIDNQLAQDRLGIQKAEEARKVTSDANKDKYNQGRLEAAKNLPRERYIDDAFKNSDTVESFNKAMALYDLMHPANQAPPATGGAAVTPALPGAQQAPIIPQVPRGYDTPGNPAFGQQGAPPPPSGILNPKAAADIAAKNAQADLAKAKIPGLATEELNKLSQIDHRKAMDENAKTVQQLNKEKIGLTHAQMERTKALAELQPSLMNAQIDLAKARASAEVARIEYMGAQEQHMKYSDQLKSFDRELTDVKKRGDIFKQATSMENYYTKQRYAQEKALEKSKATYITYKNYADTPDDKIEKEGDRIVINNARKLLPQIEQDIKDTQARIDDITKNETFAHTYVAKTKDILHVSGATDADATAKMRADAEAKAKKAAEDAKKSAADALKFGTTINPEQFPFVQPTRPRTAPPGAHPKVQAVAPGKTSGNQKTGKLKVVPPKTKDDPLGLGLK